MFKYVSPARRAATNTGSAVAAEPPKAGLPDRLYVDAAVRSKVNAHSRATRSGKANTKRRYEGTMKSDRPVPPKSATPVPQFTSDKMVGSPL
jgi:hypothetical protein